MKNIIRFVFALFLVFLVEQKVMADPFPWSVESPLSGHQITLKWLNDRLACADGTAWFITAGETDPMKLMIRLIKERHYSWANWFVVRLMTYKQYVAYSVFAAEQTALDNQSKKAVQVARECIQDPSIANKARAKALSMEMAKTEHLKNAEATSIGEYAYKYKPKGEDAFFSSLCALNAASVEKDSLKAYDSATFAAVYAMYENPDKASQEQMKIKILNYGLSLL